ncbi:MAG: hypothetical protein MUF57_04280 [Gammaproteobacteria bacterium]|jgi:hypothetical protein|nr:hypothetical protein [Gammaproteobacteria bacterium]
MTRFSLSSLGTGIGGGRPFLNALVSMGLLAAPPAVEAANPFGDRLENGRVIAFASTDVPPGRLGATVVCLDGYKFGVAAMMGLGNAAGSSIAMVQVMEDRDGRLAPAICR